MEIVISEEKYTGDGNYRRLDITGGKMNSEF